MAVADLTGYTWVGNSSLSIQNEIGLFSINFTSDGTEYGIIGIGKNPQTEATKLNRLFYGMETYTVYYNSWESEAYKTITITGGTDATNATLIAWFEANGTLTAPQPTVVYDLDNLNLSTGTYTITVKAKATGYADSINSNSISYTILPQLPSSSNVSVDGTDVSFDEVENAESYDILVDGNSIGEYTPQSGYSGNIVAYDALENGGYTYIKFDAAPSSSSDYDSMVDVYGDITGDTTYQNKTKAYIWGEGLACGVMINGQKTSCANTSYSNAVEITLSGNYDIGLIYRMGSN